jgi:hypothetical protein
MHNGSTYTQKLHATHLYVANLKSNNMENYNKNHPPRLRTHLISFSQNNQLPKTSPIVASHPGLPPNKLVVHCANSQVARIDVSACLGLSVVQVKIYNEHQPMFCRIIKHTLLLNLPLLMHTVTIYIYCYSC